MKIKLHSIAILSVLLFFITASSLGQETKEDSAQLSNLEDIPFTLPENWSYHKNPGSLPKAFKGMAGAPPTGEVSVTVWAYEVDSYEELVPLLKRDMISIGGIQDVTMSLGDTLINGVTIQTDKKFKWIAKHFKNNGELRLVAVGTWDHLFEEKQEVIKTIFNSIRKD